MSFSFHIWALLLALIIDAIIGDPDWLWRRVSHPVVWFGHVISGLDEHFNRSSDSRKERGEKGLFILAFLIFLAAAAGLALQYLMDVFFLSWAFEAVVVAVFLSGRSLYDHVQRVAEKLEKSDLAQARRSVAHIVGRDTETLDRSGISRAAIESLAENFSDGVIAPAVWYLIAGLPGLIIYKVINTADSMIGHKTGRHRDFGRGVARFDDLINLPASRITAGLCVIGAALRHGSTAAQNAWSVIRKDAAKHRSPNAGWPEAAMAGALNIALSGPRTYENTPGNEPWINEGGRRQLGSDDIRTSLRLYLTSGMVFVGLLVFLGIFLT
jgi:adenosylcobinamide-phosphate synthase